MKESQDTKQVIMSQIDNLLVKIKKQLSGSLLITGNSKLEPVTQPKSIVGGQLKDYQLQALAWMAQLDKNLLSGILADDMGLGKTIQTIAYLSYIYDKTGNRGKHLIVVPKNVLNNWKRQFAKWQPNFNVVILPGTQQERQKCIKEFIRPGNFDVLIATYQSVQTAELAINKYTYRVLVVDEAHSIKNDDTYISCCLRRLKFKFSLLLTGTPLSNQLKQLWSLLNFIAPKLFSDSGLFKRIQDSVNLNCSDDDQKIRYQSKIAAKFKAIINPFMMRRVKSQIKLGLKQKKQFTLFVSLSELQLKMYRNFLKFHNVYGQDQGYQHCKHVQLRKICAHPYTFTQIEDPNAPPLGEHLIENSGKMKLLDKLLNKLLKQNHKVLIFSQFVSLLKILQDYCDYRKYKYSTITGQNSLQQRDQAVENFSNKNDTNIFLISTRAGGIGLNLVAADVVIIYDLDWNPQMDKQATDRAYRIGQKKSVKVFKFITNNTVEQRLLQVQKYKLIWDQLVIQKGGLAKMKAIQDKFQKIDHDQIAGLGAQQIFKLQQNYDDNTIQQIIKMGEQKDNKKTEQIRAKLQKQFEALGQNFNPFAQLQNVKSSSLKNIQYDEQQVGHRKKNKNGSKLSWKQRQINNQHQLKKNNLIKPYHLFSNKQKAGQILIKMQQLDQSQGTKSELNEYMNKLDEFGFYSWSKQQFNQFIQANMTYRKADYSKISELIKTKKQNEVKMYSQAYFERAENQPALKNQYKKIIKKQQQLQKQYKLREMQNRVAKISSKLIYQQKSRNQPIYASMSVNSLMRMYVNSLTKQGLSLGQKQIEILQKLNPTAYHKAQLKYNKPNNKIQLFTKILESAEEKTKQQYTKQLQDQWQSLHKCYFQKSKTYDKSHQDDSAKTAIKN